MLITQEPLGIALVFGVSSILMSSATASTWRANLESSSNSKAEWVGIRFEKQL